MEVVLSNILNPDTNIDITGKIFICDELCNLDCNFFDYDKLTLFNRNKYLEIQYNNKSFVNFNGNGSINLKYYLQKIIIISPPKHFINSSRDLNNLELILIFQSDKKYLLVSVFMSPVPNENDPNYISKLSYKLVEKFSNSLPTKTIQTLNISNVGKWNIEDLLPEDKSFYTYIAPTDDTINWIVYQNPIYVPKNLKENYDKYVLKNIPDYAKLLNEAKVPMNPSNLTLFNHQINKNVTMSCAKKLDDSIKDDSVNKDKNNLENKNDTDKNNLENKDETKKKEEGTNWMSIIIITFIVIIILLIIGFIIYYFYNNPEQLTEIKESFGKMIASMQVNETDLNELSNTQETSNTQPTSNTQETSNTQQIRNKQQIRNDGKISKNGEINITPAVAQLNANKNEKENENGNELIKKYFRKYGENNSNS